MPVFNVNLEVLRLVKQKSNLPDPSDPLSKTVLPTAIAAAKVKVNKNLYIHGIPSPHLTLQMCAPF